MKRAIVATILSLMSGLAKADDECMPLSVLAELVSPDVQRVEIYYGAQARGFIAQFNREPPATDFRGDIAVVFEYDADKHRPNTIAFVGHRLSIGDYEFCGAVEFTTWRVLFRLPSVWFNERKYSL